MMHDTTGTSEVKSPARKVRHLPERTLAARVHSELRRRIVSRRISAGSRLVVDRLSEEFGVSITPIREALRLLEKDQLIEFRPHCGATVISPSTEIFQDLSEVRAALEPAVARRACPRLTENDLAALEKTLETGRACLEGKTEPAQWIEADDAFHGILLDRCDNPLLVESLERLMDRIRLQREVYFVAPERIRQSLQEHREILETLRNRDADGAAERMARHMQSYVRLEESRSS